MARKVDRGRLLAAAIVVGLVTAGGLVVATGRVVVADPVVDNAGSSLYETATAPYSFINRSYENVSLNTTISVSFFDADSYSPHTFTIIGARDYEIPNPAGQSNGNLTALIHANGTLVNVTSTPLNTTFATIAPVTQAGWYEFVCLEPGHFQAGMYGFIAFGEALPAGLGLGSTTPGPGIAVFIIIGTIVSLTVLAIVLGFVVGQRHGSEHEMPPERLGYPEPLPTAAPAAGGAPPTSRPPGSA
jgi:hypothetical protein